MQLELKNTYLQSLISENKQSQWGVDADANEKGSKKEQE